MALVPYRRLPPIAYIGEVVRGAVSPFVVASAEEGKDRGPGDPGSRKKKKKGKPPPHVGVPRGRSPSSRLDCLHSQISGWLNEPRRDSRGKGQCRTHQYDAETRLGESNVPTSDEKELRVSHVEERSRWDGLEVEPYPRRD